MARTVRDLVIDASTLKGNDLKRIKIPTGQEGSVNVEYKAVSAGGLVLAEGVMHVKDNGETVVYLFSGPEI